MLRLLQTQGGSTVPDTKVFFPDPTFYSGKRKHEGEREGGGDILRVSIHQGPDRSAQTSYLN